MTKWQSTCGGCQKSTYKSDKGFRNGLQEIPKKSGKASEGGLKNDRIYVDLMAGQIRGTPGSQFGESHRLFSNKISQE